MTVKFNEFLARSCGGGVLRVTALEANAFPRRTHPRLCLKTSDFQRQGLAFELAAGQPLNESMTSDPMTQISINQAVDVYSHPPIAQGDGVIQGDEHIHTFENLIPACEFAVALAKEGHLNITLQAASHGALDLGEAQKIVSVWESGVVSLDAEELEFEA